MKIAHVISTFPPKIGGMGQVCSEEVKRLAAAGHQVTVFTLAYPETAVTSEAGAAPSFKIVCLKTLRLGDAGLAWQLFWRLRGFDIVHLHYPFYGAYEWILLARFFWRQKYLLTYHMDASPVGWLKKSLQKIYDRLWARPLIKNAERVIGVDEEHLRHAALGRLAVKDKRRILRLGVDGDFFHPRVLKARRIGDYNLTEQNVLLFVGNLLPFKRLDLILSALQKLSDPNLMLIVVGGGYQEEIYQKMAEDLGVVRQVIFTGSCTDRKKLARYYHLANVLVLPSSEAESFSLVILEAMASGLPVIASNLPGPRARVCVGQDGFLFEVGSADDLVVKIKEFFALSAGQRRIMGLAGRAKVLKRYNWENHVAQLTEIYGEVVGKN